MGRLSGPRHRLAGLAFLLAFAVLLAVAVPALADYLGPNRTVAIWEWQRLHCRYEAVYNPPGAGWYGCTLDLYDTPASSCLPTGGVAGYFTPSACSWPSAFCQTYGCAISGSGSVGSCSEGETGCTAVERTTTLPEATISGSVSCGVPGYGGWCLGTAALSLSGGEPLAGHSILALEGTRDGETFACPGDACGVPLLEGSNDFTFWAISSWGDTSLMGSASGGLDTQPPVISGEISGAAGDNGWYLSDVAFSASASDPSPGSGLLSFELSLDGGGWTAYTGPLTLSDGSHTVELRAGDTAGNMSTQSPTVRVDTQPPGLDLIANASFCPGCGEPLGVAVDVQDAGSGVVEWTLSADAGLVASGSGPTSQVLPWDGSGLPGGRYTLSLRARDAAGNTSESSLAVNLLVPTPSPPPAELPPAETPPGSGPTWSTAVQLATPTAVPTATRPSHPTRTPEVIPFGGVPAAPLGNEGEEPRSNPPAEILGGPQPSVPGSSSGVLWGGAALALIGAATAIALDQVRRRREEEARQREEMERRNAAQRAREEAEQARIAAAAAVRAQQVQVSPDYGAIVGAALGAAGAEERTRAAQDRRVERREEEMEAAEQAARERAAAEVVRQAEEAARAAALAQAERLRAIAEGRHEYQPRATPPTETPTPPATPTGTAPPSPAGGATPERTLATMPAPIVTPTPEPPEVWPPVRESATEREPPGVRASDETYLSPLFYDPQADFNGRASAQMAVGSPPYGPIPGNPSDPSVPLDGVGPAWWLQLGVLARRFLAPFSSARYLADLEPNVDVELYFATYQGEGFRLPGLTLENGSSESIWVNRISVNGFGYSRVLLPMDIETFAGVAYLPPAVGPTEYAVLPIEDSSPYLAISPYIDVEVRLLAGDRLYIPSWRIWSTGQVQQVMP